jgi:uncharacterized protein YydD (DUF2326 family)
MRISIYKQIKDLKSEHLRTFRKLVERFYGSGTDSGIIIENNEGENNRRYNIEVYLQNDSGDAFNEVKIFCYDWTVLLGQKNHKNQFLFHDSRITGDMDARQIKTMLEIADEKCRSHSFQYIISLNQGSLDNISEELEEDEYEDLVEQNIILELSDESEKSKLLGVDLDIKYDK